MRLLGGENRQNAALVHQPGERIDEFDREGFAERRQNADALNGSGVAGKAAADPGAVRRTAGDDAGRFEPGEGAPDGDPAATGEPGEIPFRRQPVSRHVFAGQQAVDDPHPDLFGQISGTDGTPPVFVVL